MLAAGLLGAAAIAAVSAAPAMAAGCPAGSSCADATVHINQVISFAFTSGTTFSLDPAGVVSHGALAFTVTTNDAAGYTVSLAGTDPATAAGASFPATSLSYSTFQGGGQVGSTNGLTNAAATFQTLTHPSSPNGDQYTQDWAASSVPGNTPPGDYASTLTFVATGR
jgi:hypothetical protein